MRSKASFQAAWWTSAVLVTTPSRSKMTASKGGLAAAAVGDPIIGQWYQQAPVPDRAVGPGAGYAVSGWDARPTWFHHVRGEVMVKRLPVIEVGSIRT